MTSARVTPRANEVNMLILRDRVMLGNRSSTMRGFPARSACVFHRAKRKQHDSQERYTIITPPQ
eukprot:10276647-Alexandrium_andersonii.AAC.1